MTGEDLQLEERRGLFGNRGELGDVIKLSIPIVVATCSRMVMDVTDYWMISRTGDSDAQAAILPAQMVIWAYIVIGMGTVSIINTMASQSLGRGDRRTCSAYAWQGLYLSMVFWLIGAALWSGMPYIFWLAGHEPRIQMLEGRYAAIIVWTIGPTIAAIGLSSFFNGVHRPRVTAMAAVESVAVNAVVSFVLIFGKLGFPAMGIEGAAWGTVVGTNYRAVRLMAAFCASGTNREFSSRSTWRIDRAKIVNIFRVGGPTGLQWCSDVTVWAIFTAVLVGSYFGKTHQLATNAAWQYLRISFMPCVGVGTALSALVGRAIGEGDHQRAIRVTRVCAVLMIGYMGLLSLVYFLGRHELIAFFTDNAEVIRIGSGVMICAAVFQVFDALGITYNSALRGAGDTFIPSVVFVVSHWVIVIGGGFAMAELYPRLGSVGPWIAASLLIIVVGIYLWRRWHGRRWMHIDLFKHEGSAGGQPDVETELDDQPGCTASEPAA